MVDRVKTTILLGRPIRDWLQAKVNAGEYPSLGWAIEYMLRDVMRAEEQKKKKEQA